MILKARLPDGDSHGAIKNVAIGVTMILIAGNQYKNLKIKLGSPTI